MSIKTTTVLANNIWRKGRPWLALQPQASGMTQNGNGAMRESTFRFLASTQMLGVSGQTGPVMTVMNGHLEDEPRCKSFLDYVSSLALFMFNSRSVSTLFAQDCHSYRIITNVSSSRCILSSVKCSNIFLLSLRLNCRNLYSCSLNSQRLNLPYSNPISGHYLASSAHSCYQGR